MTFQFKSTNEVLTGQGGLPIFGQILRHLPLINRLLASKIPEAEAPDISHAEVVLSYLGLLAQGDNDYDHIEAVRQDAFFKMALNIEQVPSSATLRQRLDQAAAAESNAQWGHAMNESSDALLRQYAQIQPITIGKQQYVPLDVDVSPMDNSKTKKQGVSRTYKGVDGYAPNFAYLGHEGYALAIDFREGKQHCQKGTPAFLTDCIQRAKTILGPKAAGESPDLKLLLRLDAGNDSTDNMDLAREGQADFLIKRNLRGEKPAEWLAVAKAQQNAPESNWVSPRPGKTVYQGETWRAPKAGHVPERIVYEVIERTSTASGQMLCVPEVEVATYWTSLADPVADILPWYPDHGTMEQYHSEFKTDLDLERLPSGKFATNRLIMDLALLAFNVLRVIGQATLAFLTVPLRQPAVRRRIRTVVQHVIGCAAKCVRHGRTVTVRYAQTNPWGAILGPLYAAFA
jgi:hypothetical protein